ncbi:hypothetical protein BsWGS_04654 [Bradybaena similaris]
MHHSTFQTAVSFRHCEENGTWQMLPNGKSWTNISACSHNTSYYEDIKNNSSVSYIYLYIAGSSLSLLLVTVALAIFHGFRQLQCDRITIHKNLLVSYVFTAVTWISYFRLVTFDGFVILENALWCQLLHVIGQYFATTNFSWMFCEGLYLHMIMAQALTTGKTRIKWLAIGGWGVPFLLTSVYAATRVLQKQPPHSCWIHDDKYQWIIAAPVVASIVINICILVNLVRQLMTKLKQVPNVNESRKAAKATLILVPLFGLQFLLLPVRPQLDSSFYPVYLHFMALLMSLQGTMVSFIFCFCNGEVRSLIRRKWQQHRLMTGHNRKNTGFTSSTLVDGYSVIESTREGTVHCSKTADNHYHMNIEEIELKISPAVTTPLVEKDTSNEMGIIQIDNCIT